MRTKRWASMMLAGGTAAAAALTMAPTAAHAAAVTLTIGVGGDSTVNGVDFEGMRFDAPSDITVHKGDTLTFDFRGFHTATLLPVGVGADGWRMDNASHVGKANAGPYALALPDSDDSPANFEFNKKVLLPSDPTCGTSSNPCAYDGKSLVNSGAPIQSPSFSVTISANPGDTFWVLCLVHSGMQMRVSVVADNVATTTQSAINGYASATLARDKQEASALISRLNHQTRHKLPNGRYVWDVYVGYDAAGWGLDAMFPKVLHIKKGQAVRWHFAQLMGNTHTVTFPRSTAIALSNSDFSGQRVRCESSSGDTAPTAQPPTFCANGGIANAEFEIRRFGVVREGTGKYNGHGLHSSGVEGAEGLSFAPYQLTFTAVSPKTGFKYACAVHGAMMSGVVFVR